MNSHLAVFQFFFFRKFGVDEIFFHVCTDVCYAVVPSSICKTIFSRCWLHGGKSRFPVLTRETAICFTGVHGGFKSKDAYVYRYAVNQRVKDSSASYKVTSGPQKHTPFHINTHKKPFKTSCLQSSKFHINQSLSSLM